MKNPLSFLSRKNLEMSLGILGERFPLAACIVVVITGLFLYTVNAESDSVLLLRTVFSLITTFFLSVGLVLASENKDVQHPRIWQYASLVYGGIFFVTINPLSHEWMIDSITYFILHLVGFIGLLFFAPYWKNLFYGEKQSAEYTNYFSHVAWALLMSCIVGLALIALGYIAIASVMTLFDLSSLIQESKLYGNWAVIVLSFITPLYCLIHLPKVTEIEKRNYETDRFFSFLIRYVATPFIILYFIILYAYSAKVLLNFQDWPKGMISWMVVGFSSFGYLTYIFSKSYETKSNIITLFRRYFPYAVPAQILMLAYAIYLRIAQYDLTMNRYFVVIFGVWLAIISAYYILSQRKSLTMVSTSLSIIALIISVGPWSVYRLPLLRQYNHLIHNLTTAGMYQDGVISKRKDTLDMALENDIYSEIEYVCNYSHCEKIKTLFAKELTGKEVEYEKRWKESEYNKSIPYPGMSNWEIVNEVTSALGISYRSPGFEYNNKYISLGVKDGYDDITLFPLDVTGYTKILRVYSKHNYSLSTNKAYITIDPDAESLILHGYGADKTASLMGFNESLKKRYPASMMTLGSNDLTTTLEVDGFTIKLILQGYGYKNPEYQSTENKNEYLGISGYALIK